MDYKRKCLACGKKKFTQSERVIDPNRTKEDYFYYTCTNCGVKIKRVLKGDQ